MIRTITIISSILIACSVRLTMGQENYAIKDIEFKGNETLSDQTLLEQMNTRSATLLEKMAFWKQMPEFSSVMLENDMERLHRYYQRHGFLNSRLDYALKENEKRKNMVIHIEVKERDPVKIRSVQFREPADSAVASLLKEITDDLPLKPGDRFIDREVLNFERYIRDFFYNRGYPFAEVDRDVEVHPDEELADIGFKVKPGSKAYFGEARIKGDSLVSETFIRKKLTFSEGEEYSEYKLDSTQTRLFNTDLFRYVVVRGQKDSMQNSEIPVLIEVSELPTWSLEAGVGYGTEDRFRASVNLTKLRFLGGARKLIFEGKHSYFLPISLETKLIQPEFLNDKLDLVLNPFFIRENEESYTVDRLGGGITLRQNFSTTTSGYMMYSLERDFLQDFTISEYLAREESSDLIRNKSGLTVGFFTNTTNKLIAPVSGWKLNGNFTYMGIGFRSQFHYYKSEVSLIRYIQIEDDWTAAGRIRSGFIKPLGDESSPIEDRFLLGGASSLRGWGRHQISPVNEEGKLTGGNSMLEGSLELRFPIYDIFSGVAFTDMGNVWRKAFTYNLADLRFDAGAGLRVRTPVGPVRLDIASPVFEEKKEPRFFISIGHTF